MSAKSSEEAQRLTGAKPTQALKRFAAGLDGSSDPDRRRFQELNRSRVDTFIRKPYDNTAKYREGFRGPKPVEGKQGFYDYTDKTEHFSLHLDAPELQRQACQ